MIKRFDPPQVRTMAAIGFLGRTPTHPSAQNLHSNLGLVSHRMCAWARRGHHGRKQAFEVSLGSDNKRSLGLLTRLDETLKGMSAMGARRDHPLRFVMVEADVKTFWCGGSNPTVAIDAAATLLKASRVDGAVAIPVGGEALLAAPSSLPRDSKNCPRDLARALTLLIVRLTESGYGFIVYVDVDVVVDASDQTVEAETFKVGKALRTALKHLDSHGAGWYSRKNVSRVLLHEVPGAAGSGDHRLAVRNAFQTASNISERPANAMRNRGSAALLEAVLFADSLVGSLQRQVEAVFSLGLDFVRSALGGLRSGLHALSHNAQAAAARGGGILSAGIAAALGIIGGTPFAPPRLDGGCLTGAPPTLNGGMSGPPIP